MCGTRILSWTLFAITLIGPSSSLSLTSNALNISLGINKNLRGKDMRKDLPVKIGTALMMLDSLISLSWPLMKKKKTGKVSIRCAKLVSSIDKLSYNTWSLVAQLGDRIRNLRVLHDPRLAVSWNIREARSVSVLAKTM